MIELRSTYALHVAFNVGDSLKAKAKQKTLLSPFCLTEKFGSQVSSFKGIKSSRLAGAQLRTSAVADMNAEHDLRMGWRFGCRRHEKRSGSALFGKPRHIQSTKRAVISRSDLNCEAFRP